LYPAFDRWARTKLVPGDHVLSSYGYANSCFKYARSHGGKTFVDGGNSHPENFWNLLVEEHRTWGCNYPPISRQHYGRAMKMMEDVDYVLSPSEFVTNSFLERGFRDDQILRVFFPVDLSVFRSERAPRPPDRPFTVINTGGLSLRKGTPYLLESFRMIRKQIPDARFLLTDSITDSIKPIMARYSDLPIEWAPYLPEAELADRLRTADLFILPSLEEGLVRTALQAMACGLPVVLTPNTGANDYVEEGVNGSVVPLRDPAAITREAEWWWEKIKGGYQVPEDRIVERLSFPRLDRVLNEHLERIGE
jgi:starch synthase